MLNHLCIKKSTLYQANKSSIATTIIPAKYNLFAFKILILLCVYEICFKQLRIKPHSRTLIPFYAFYICFAKTLNHTSSRFSLPITAFEIIFYLIQIKFSKDVVGFGDVDNLHTF